MNRKSSTPASRKDASKWNFTAPTRGHVEAQLNELKENLLSCRMRHVTDSKLAQLLSRAANEAAALAWFTNCPMLVLPSLLEEKIAVALQWGEKQERLRQQ